MDVFTGLNNSKIAIVGMGYLGRNLFSELQDLQTKFSFSIETFTRKNIETMRNQSFDFVFNCSGNTGDFRSNIWQTIESNLSVSQFIQENVNITKALVLMSSTRVYGFTDAKDSVFIESDNLSSALNDLSNIDFVYNGTKILLESAALNYGKQSNTKTVICRLSNIYGNYHLNDLDDATYLKVLLKKAYLNESVLIKQNAQNSKDYVHIEDAVKGILLSALHSDNSGIYNIASGQSYTLQDWLDFLKINYTFDDKLLTPTFSNISINKAKKELKYSPKKKLSNIAISQIIQL